MAGEDERSATKIGPLQSICEIKTLRSQGVVRGSSLPHGTKQKSPEPIRSYMQISKSYKEYPKFCNFKLIASELT